MKGASMALVPANLEVGFGSAKYRHGMTAGDGLRLGALLDMHRLLIQLNHLDTIPERTPGKPRVSLLINNEIRVDGIPVVSIALGGDEAALILPSILIR